MLSLPQKFLRKEDEDRGLKYFGQMIPLSDSFEPLIGATKIIEVCSSFIRINGGLTQAGIFRVPGDEGELNLAKVRLQYSSQNVGTRRIILSENGHYILIGDIEGLTRAKSGGTTPIPNATSSGAKKAAATSSSSIDQDSSNNNSTVEGASLLPEEAPTSVVVLRNVNTVAQIFKMSIRDLPEALVPFDSYTKLIDTTRKHEHAGLSEEWEHDVIRILAALPHQHISTLVYVIRFLREVVQERESNSMDSSNVATIFAPTVFRPDMVDPMKAIMELRLSQRIIKEIIDRKIILYEAVRQFKAAETKRPASEKVVTVENPVLSNHSLQLLRPEVSMPPVPPPRPSQMSSSSRGSLQSHHSSGSHAIDELSASTARLSVEIGTPPPATKSEEDISQSLSPTMMGRLARSGGRESMAVSRHNRGLPASESVADETEARPHHTDHRPHHVNHDKVHAHGDDQHHRIVGEQQHQHSRYEHKTAALSEDKDQHIKHHRHEEEKEETLVPSRYASSSSSSASAAAHPHLNIAPTTAASEHTSGFVVSPDVSPHGPTDRKALEGKLYFGDEMENNEGSGSGGNDEGSSNTW